MAKSLRFGHCLCKFRWKFESSSPLLRTYVNYVRTTKLLPFNKTTAIYIQNRHSSRPGEEPDLNPLKRIQSYVATPIIPPDEVLFDPTKEEIANGENLFIPRVKHKIEFLKSALYTDHLPQYDLPEVAFVGRSNVGKSSLIRAILGDVADIRVDISSKPGHTKTLNFYQVGQALTLVDMPGYGFHMPKHFQNSVEPFLKSRRKLVRTFVLIDGTQGINSNDVIGLDMMEEFAIPYVGKVGMKPLDEEFANGMSKLGISFCIVMTKIDKTSQSKLLKNFMTVLNYRNEANFCFYQPFLTSAFTRDGISLLQTFIGYVSGNVRVQGL